VVCSCSGLSAASLLLFNGDVLGASCLMASTALHPKKTLTDPNNYWKLVLLSSFMMTSTIILGTQFGKDSRTENDDGVPIISPLAYSLGGLLVGFGTRIGNGCTSGHGVCGLARLSPRSFIAVITFMMTAIITVFLTSPTAPWAKSTEFLRTDNVSPVDSQLGMQITSLVVGAAVMAPFMFKGTVNQSKLGPAALSGSLFASGLAVSQMVLGSKLFGFLNVGGIADGSWDPTLMTVLGSACGISFISYQFTEHFSVVNHGNQLTCPLKADMFSVPTNKIIDINLVAGSAIFGIGWALALLCPGPALFLAATGHQGVIFQWLPAFFVGSMTAEKYKQA
jgi:uncharacterized membrane protein YedE/YeeE